MHALLDFNVDISIFGIGLQAVLVNEWLEDECEEHVHVFIPAEWCVEVEVFGVGCRKLRPRVLMTLFQSIFAAVRSAVWVVSS